MLLYHNFFRNYKRKNVILNRMLNSATHAGNTNGNVIFFILLAVALFGGLTYAVTSSDQGQGEATLFDRGQTSVNSSQADLCTSKINSGIEYLKSVNGCSQSEISYELADGSNENTDAPVDERCHLFKRKGAGLQACGTYTDVIVSVTTLIPGDTTIVATRDGISVRCLNWNGNVCESYSFNAGSGTRYIDDSGTRQLFCWVATNGNSAVTTVIPNDGGSPLPMPYTITYGDHIKSESPSCSGGTDIGPNPAFPSQRLCDYNMTGNGVITYLECNWAT